MTKKAISYRKPQEVSSKRERETLKRWKQCKSWVWSTWSAPKVMKSEDFPKMLPDKNSHRLRVERKHQWGAPSSQACVALKSPWSWCSSGPQRIRPGKRRSWKNFIKRTDRVLLKVMSRTSPPRSLRRAIMRPSRCKCRDGINLAAVRPLLMPSSPT